MEVRRATILIFFLTLLLFLTPEVSLGEGNDGQYFRMDYEQFRIWYRDPNNIQAMELDQQNRTLYVGCEYGLVIRDLEDETYTLISQEDGLAYGVVMDIEMDLQNRRVFVILEYEDDIFEINTQTKEVSQIHRFASSGTTLLPQGRSKAIEYEGCNQTIYFARDSGILVYNMKTKDYRFFDVFHFGVSLSSYQVLDDGFKASMMGFNKDRYQQETPEYFNIGDVELIPRSDRLLIGTTLGLTELNTSSLDIIHHHGRTDLPKNISDILHVQEENRIFIGGDFLVSMEISSNNTLRFEDYGNYVDREGFRSDQVLEIGYNPEDRSVYVSPSSQLGLVSFDAVSGEFRKVVIDKRLYPDNSRYDPFQMEAYYLTLIYDESRGTIIAGNGHKYDGGYIWSIEYHINGTVEMKMWENETSSIIQTSYNIVQELNIDERRKLHRGTQTNPLGSTIEYDPKIDNTTNLLLMDFWWTEDSLRDIEYHPGAEKLMISIGWEDLYLFDPLVGELVSRRFEILEPDKYSKNMGGYHYIKEIEIYDSQVYLTSTKGLMRYDPLSDIDILIDPNLKGRVLKADPSTGHLFINANNGVVEFDPGDNSTRFWNTSLEPDHIAISSDGNRILCSTRFQGSVLFNKDTENITPFMKDLKYKPGYYVGEALYHKDTDSFYVLTRDYGILNVEDLDNHTFGNTSTYSYCCLGPRGDEVLAVTGWFECPGGNMASLTYGPNGLATYDPVTGKIEEYTTEEGLPSIECMGVASDHENDRIFIVAECFIAMAERDELGQNISEQSIPETWVRSALYPFPEGVGGYDTSSGIHWYEDRYVMGAAGAGTLTLLGVAFVLFEPLKFKLLSSLWVPFFTRISRKKALENRNRKGILKVIEQEPFIHFNGIRRSLSMGPGTAAYHLKVLEREGYIRSKIKGVRKVFFIEGKEGPPLKHHLTHLQKELMDMAGSDPGISQREISRRMQKNPSTINYNIKILERNGSLRIVKKGNRTRCYRNDN